VVVVAVEVTEPMDLTTALVEVSVVYMVEEPEVKEITPEVSQPAAMVPHVLFGDLVDHILHLVQLHINLQ
jgi:hypothetical protein